MEDLERQWAEQLKASPFLRPRFTQTLKQEILVKAKQSERVGTRRWPVRLLPVMSFILLIGISIFFLPWLPHANEKENAAWLVRPQYEKGGKELFRIFPDPYLSAGKPTGYIFHFTEPFGTFAGKKLAIYATHKDTGTRVTVLAPQTINEPSPGYPGLERLGIRSALPLSGMWRYDVELDGAHYGDAVLSAADSSWEVSPMFTSGSYYMRGIEGRVGFIDAGFIAGRGNKYMWHLWGTDQELDGKFLVAAVKQGTTKIIDVFSADSLGGGINGADRTLPSSMSLPEPGRWRLLVYIDDRLFDSIVVDVRG